MDFYSYIYYSKSRENSCYSSNSWVIGGKLALVWGIFKLAGKNVKIGSLDRSSFMLLPSIFGKIALLKLIPYSYTGK